MSKPVELTPENRAALLGVDAQGKPKSLKAALEDAVNNPNHPLNRRDTLQVPKPATPVSSKAEVEARVKGAQAARDKAKEDAKPKPSNNPWDHKTGDAKADALFQQRAAEHEQKQAQAAAAKAEDEAKRSSPQFAEALQAAQRRVDIAKGTPMEAKSLTDLETLKATANVESFNVESEKTLAGVRADLADKRKALNTTLSSAHLESANLSEVEAHRSRTCDRGSAG